MQYWGLTDPGCARPQNQDAFQIEQLDKNTLLCVVCDGMGGAKSGNVASSLAVDVFTQEVCGTWNDDMDQEQQDRMLHSAVKLTNFTVHDQAQQFEDFTGMGTTLVAVLLRGRQVTVVNVGDSRAYNISARGVTQLTEDHSLVQLMVKKGELTPEQARFYPGKNLITRAMGTEAVVEPDIFHFRVEKGDCLLLCTDGLSNIIDEQEMLFEVIHGDDRAQCCQRLIDIAKNRGAPDNVTCILVSV